MSQEKIAKEKKINKISWIMLLAMAFGVFFIPWTFPFVFENVDDLKQNNPMGFAKVMTYMTLVLGLFIFIFSKLMTKSTKESPQVMVFSWLGVEIGLAIGFSIWLFMG